MTQTQAMQHLEPLGSPSAVASVCEGMAVHGAIFSALYLVLKLVIFHLHEHIGPSECDWKLRLKPSDLVVSQLLTSVGEYNEWF